MRHRRNGFSWRGDCRYRTVNTSPSSSAKQAQEALGVRLREIRKDAGFSGRALAVATGQHFTSDLFGRPGHTGRVSHPILRAAAALIPRRLLWKRIEPG